MQIYSDEDRSNKRKNIKQKGFKIATTNDKANEIKGKSESEPIYQINTNNKDLISFETDSAASNLEIWSNNNVNTNFSNLFNNNNNDLNINNFNSSNNNSSKQSGFAFINKNNTTSNTNPSNSNCEFFSVGNNNNLMDLNSNDKIIDQKLKKITENIDELYKNPNQFNKSHGSSCLNLNNPNKTNNQNDLFYALNPQHNLNYVNISQPNINIQNSYYNFNPNYSGSGVNSAAGAQYNMNHNNKIFNGGMNMNYNGVHGLGNGGMNNSGYGANFPGNFGSKQNNAMNMKMPIGQNYANNFNRNFNNNGLLTTNDIYTKKDDPMYNLNLNQSHSNNNNNNLFEFSEVKPKGKEDPFSNLINIAK